MPFVMRRMARMGHPGGMAHVGEDGPERARFPGGGSGMVGRFGPTTMDLPAGSEVEPNPATFMRRPRYRYGTSFRYAQGTPFMFSSMRNPAMGSTAEVGNRLREAQRFGYFDPGGSEAIRARARRRAFGFGRDRRTRAATLSRLAGLDPMQQRQAILESDMEGASQLGEQLHDVDQRQEEGAQDFFRGLYGGERQFQQQRQIARDQAREARRGGGAGAMIGQIAGAAIPALPWFNRGR